MTEEEIAVRGLHVLMANLHMALALNRTPDQHSSELANSLSAWWESRRQRSPSQ